MAWDAVISADQLSGITTESAFQSAATDWKIGLAPGEVAHCQVKTASSGTTDDSKIIVYTSNIDAPGSIPDAGQTLADSDWSIYTAFVIDNTDASEGDKVWQYFSVAGVRWFSVSLQRNSGSTDSFVGDLKVATDAVDAS